MGIKTIIVDGGAVKHPFAEGQGLNLAEILNRNQRRRVESGELVAVSEYGGILGLGSKIGDSSDTIVLRPPKDGDTRGIGIAANDAGEIASVREVSRIRAAERASGEIWSGLSLLEIRRRMEEYAIVRMPDVTDEVRAAFPDLFAHALCHDETAGEIGLVRVVDVTSFVHMGERPHPLMRRRLLYAADRSQTAWFVGLALMKEVLLQYPLVSARADRTPAEERDLAQSCQAAGLDAKTFWHLVCLGAPESSSL